MAVMLPAVGGSVCIGRGSMCIGPGSMCIGRCGVCIGRGGVVMVPAAGRGRAMVAGRRGGHGVVVRTGMPTGD